MPNTAPSGTIEPELRQAAAELLKSAGREGAPEFSALSGGANNRVYRVDGAGAPLVLKAYFHHAQDQRDRLGAEYSFSRFAWDNGLRALPQPLAIDAKRRLGLYEFVEGSPLKPGEPGENDVRQALEFYCAVNRHKDAPAAPGLPLASEARFSLRGHLDLLEGRLRALLAIEASTDEDREAARFIREELAPLKNKVAGGVRELAAQWGLDPAEDLLPADRCISPSDFGFHNALKTPSGALSFLDFEYAGWDDPARMACDFFCQPAIPAPAACHGLFSQTVARGLRNPELCLKRIRLLTPVYRLKWACIILNEFLPSGGERRRFVDSVSDQASRKARQLAKARLMTSAAPDF
ncbi:MAG: aminoglycoside phosphotransferase family protein [Elusimicrobia bacterium]|nr:aminoglycoside phosphotransferase family protein [Elusimicrobiota bacterium]